MNKRAVTFVVGILIGAVGLFWALRGVEFSKVADAFANPRLYLVAIPFVAITLVSMWFRGVRNYFLLRHEAKLDQWPLFKITMIGFCYNSLLPARAGEFIRIVLLARQKRLGIARATASLVVERIYDMLIILLSMTGALLTVQIAEDISVSVFGDYEITGAQIRPLAQKFMFLGAAVAVFIALFLAGPTRNLMIRIVRAMTFIPDRFREGFVGAIESFSSGLRSVQDIRTVAWVFFLTFMVWLTVALSVWTLQFGFDGVTGLSLADGFAITVVICFAVSLPSAPAFFGMYEAGGILALLLLGVTDDRSVALSFTLAMHLLQIIPIITLGLIFTYTDHISLRKLQREAP